MSAHWQAGLALVLAAGLHLGAFASRDGPAGAVSAGAGGADLLSLQAQDAVIADLVAAWDRPPAPVAQPAAMAVPDLPPPPRTRAASDVVPVITPAAPPTATPHRAEPAPSFPVALPAPPPVPAPQRQDAPPSQATAVPAPEAVALSSPAKPKARHAQPAAPTKPAASAKPAGTMKPSAPLPAQKAAGAGGGALAGKGGSGAAASLSAGRSDDLRAAWVATIRTRIERHKAHPPAARGASGTVGLRLTISRSGQLAGVKVAKSSGHAALDAAALRAVTAAGAFPPAPQGLADPQYVFALSMKF